MKFANRPRVLLALLSIGDAVFLVFVGIAANAAMYLAHRLGWTLALAVPVGMAFAMVVQTAIALCASLILGPIESMVPSMALAMFSPMVLCGSCLFGHDLGLGAALISGAAFGFLTFVFIQFGGWYYRRRLQRAFPES